MKEDKDIKWLKQYFKSELKSVWRAVNTVEKTNGQKFKAQNEWRQQYREQAASFVTRRELWGAVLAILTIVVAVVAIVIKK